VGLASGPFGGVGLGVVAGGVTGVAVGVSLGVMGVDVTVGPGVSVGGIGVGVFVGGSGVGVSVKPMKGMAWLVLRVKFEPTNIKIPIMIQLSARRFMPRSLKR
jgi:hypothetical protein